MLNLDKINDVFKLPIFYNNNKRPINKTIVTDLELLDTHDASLNSIYDAFLNLKNNRLSIQIAKQIAECYTTDVRYLTDTQEILKQFDINSGNNIDCDKMWNIWEDIHAETDFNANYGYVDWDNLDFLNNSQLFLQILSIYQMLSPIISLTTPLIIIIIPFAVLKLRGINLTTQEYINVLKTILSQNPLGKLLNGVDQLSQRDLLMVVTSLIFYAFSIYQNVIVCIKFNTNMKKIHKHFEIINSYLKDTIHNMNKYLQLSNNFASQINFNETLKNNIASLEEMYNHFNSITEYSITNFRKITEIGTVLKHFYQIRKNKHYNDAFLYSFGFNGYIYCLNGLVDNFNNKKINICKYSVKTNKKNMFKNAYYAALKNKKYVKNNIKFNNNLIITGPNASGKTTILKTCLINVIFSQQFGCGFYEKGVLKPYDFIHCYLNIPDTSGRDSLFQAEARRCKEIIDVVNNNKQCNHFCVFDELYSGTNPEEAETSSTSFMRYLTKNKNVTTQLTTHFIKVCNNLQRVNNIHNFHLQTDNINNSLVFTYKLKKGISTVRGGIDILQKMNYPKEILDNCK